jgi:flagellar biosynthetic protein FliP
VRGDRKHKPWCVLVVVLVLVVPCSPASAQETPQRPGFTLPSVPGIGPADTPQKISTTLQILFMLTILSLAPAILIMTTCFTRIIVVLSLLRQALATQQLPPNQVIVGLALFLTFMIMAPVWTEVNQVAVTPMMDGKLSAVQAYDRGIVPVRTFMLRHVRRSDLALFLRLGKVPPNTRIDDVPTTVIIPAFIISELKTAFIMGFILYLPFLIIDMVVASVLISMGMMMLPPILISLPFKLMLFVVADGWNLVVQSLVESFM